MRIFKGLSRLLVLILGVAVVTACSGASAAPTPPPMEPVSLQLQWVTQAQFAGYYVALDKGWYRPSGRRGKEEKKPVTLGISRRLNRLWKD